MDLPGIASHFENDRVLLGNCFLDPFPQPRELHSLRAIHLVQVRIYRDGNEIILVNIQSDIPIWLWHVASFESIGEPHQQRPGTFVFGWLLQTQIRASPMNTGFPVERSEQAAKHNFEFVAITSQSAYGGPDTASPGHASLFTSTRSAYPKTHPAATCKRLCKRWQHANTIVPDPSNSQAWDRYAYAYNNPIRYNDPTGHCPLCVTAVIGGAAGAIIGAVGYTAYVAYTGQQFNTGHMLLAAGGGALAGALIGTGVGIVAGVGVAEATTAAVGAGEAANLACGGDMCASEVQDTTQIVEESAPALENAVTKVEQAADDIYNWLGDDAIPDRNDAGDFFVRNAENTKRFRFDYNDPSPHEDPHMHLDWLDEAGKWITKRIFPK